MSEHPGGLAKYTADEWTQLQPALHDLSVDTLATVRKVLVEGHNPTQLAKEIGVSRQAVHAAIKRVRERLELYDAARLELYDAARRELYDAARLEPVVAWVPKGAANSLKESIKQLIRSHGGRVVGD